MNIEMLLSVNQGHASTATSAAKPSGDTFANGFFRQALQHAANGQHRSVNEGYSTAHSTTSADDLSLESFASALEALGIRLDTETLHELMSYLGSEQASVSLSEADLPAPELLPATSQDELQEIAQRLALMSSYQQDTSTTPMSSAAEAAIRSVASQLSLEEHEVMPLLQSLSVMATPSMAPNVAAADDSRALAAPSSVPTLTWQAATPPSPLGDTANGLLRATPDTATSFMQTLAVPESALKSAPAETSFILPNSATSSGPMPSSPPIQASLGTPVSSPAWPSQLGQQLVHITQLGGEQQVKMNLHPAELGPLSISLKMTEHGAQAHFLSAHAQVRQVIEHAIPQLRDILAEQGIMLTDTSVGEQSTQQQAFAQQNSDAGTQHGNGAQEADIEIDTERTVTTTLDGRVDLYA
ncbi:flagellar hook-length control protein FliK [Halomonas sp. KM072]